ncbi:CNNM domain-containing protein, partial [Streptomyces galilaeus]|uniref:CNNM domain-containing protein n=1 Tax=Streptomyces galilaeus TaxID=33899 RepID=UPI0038F5E734
MLLSITPSYIALLRKQKPKLAKRVEALKQNIDQPLAAILTLNTIAHTAGAAGVGAQAAVVFSDAAVGIASAIMTLLV